MTTIENEGAAGAPSSSAVAPGATAPPTGTARPREKKVKRDKRPLWRKLLPWVTTIALIALEELLARTGVLPPAVPPFSQILAALGQLMQTAAFWTSLGQAMFQFLVALAIAVVVGVTLGILLGILPILNLTIRYVLEFLRFTPAVVYIPILVLLIGARPQLAIILGGIGAMWPVMYQTFYGVIGVPPILLDTGRVFGLSAAQRLRNIVIPSVSPFLATGLRLAAGYALLVVIAVQIISAVEGTGRDLANYSTNGVFPQMYALILVIGLIGLTINSVLQFVERRQLHWHPSYRETQS